MAAIRATYSIPQGYMAYRIGPAMSFDDNNAFHAFKSTWEGDLTVLSGLPNVRSK